LRVTCTASLAAGNNVHAGLPDKEVMQFHSGNAKLGNCILEEPALHLVDLDVERGHLTLWIKAVELHACGEERIPLEHVDRDRLGELNRHAHVVDVFAEIRALDV
jgi:hypothetical protein